MNLEIGKPAGFPRIQKGCIQALAISADGKTLFSACSEGLIVYYDIARKVCVKKVALPEKFARFLAVTPDGQKLIAGLSDGSVTVINLADGLQSSIPAIPGGELLAMILSPEGRTLLCGGSDRTLRLWSLPENQAGKTWSFSSPITSLVIFPDGKRLFVGGQERTLVEFPSGRPLVKLGGRLSLGPVACASAHPDNQHLFSYHHPEPGRPAEKGGTDAIRQWYLVAEKMVKSLNLQGSGKSCSGKTCMGMSNDGKYLFWGGESPGVSIWDVPANARLPAVGNETVSALLFHQDSLITGGANGAIFVTRIFASGGTQIAVPTRIWRFDLNSWAEFPEVVCDQCFTRIRVEARQPGTEIPCPYCHRKISVTLYSFG
jgi:WD40 repeat protein/DNA-directed RNA polymerase subunit RPC12/RpoP